MALIGRNLRATSRVAMAAFSRSISSVTRPAISSTCSPLASTNLLANFNRSTSLASRSYYLLSKLSTKPVPCGCGCNGVHTKGDQELVDFLTEEISAETKAQKSPKLPKIEGFESSADGAAITLTRKFNNENIKVTFNVNHTVDADMDEPEVSPSHDKAEAAEMKSKPNFSVEIEKGGKILDFGCSIVQQGFQPEEAGQDESYDDVFNIDEVALYEKERSDSVYAVSGEIMDGYLYDLLMNYLEERGISNQFAESLIDYATSYEHKQYIKLLDDMKLFLTAK